MLRAVWRVRPHKILKLESSILADVQLLVLS